MSLRRLAVASFLAVLVLALAVFAARDAIGAFGIRAAVHVLGYDFSSERMHVGADSLVAIKPVVRNRAGEPVFAADRLDVSFSVRDLLPGSRARFGLRAVDLDHPILTLIHHADGTYNVALPQANGPPPRPDNTPLDVRVRVRNGTIALIDRFVVPNHERIESLTGVRVDAILSPADPSYYRVNADLQDGSRRYPIVGRARFDHARGFASQHWHADELPVGPLIDFAIATHAVNLVDGRLRGADARIYGFIHDDGTTASQMSAVAELVDGKLFAAQLRSAVGDMHGMLRVHERGIDTTGIDATLAHVPLHLVGGIYDLADPKLRMLLTGSGPLRLLRTVAAASEHRPIDGDLRFALRVDGPLTQPVVRGTFSSPAISYGTYVLRDAAGSIAFSGQDFQLSGVSAQYGPLRLSAAGALTLGRDVDSDIVATVDGPSTGMPYAASLLGPAGVHAIVHLLGTNARLAGRGYVAGRGDVAALDAPFALDADGNGTVGPVVLRRREGASLYGRVAFNRSAGLVDGILSAHRLALLPAAPATLPGFSAAAFPRVRGTLDADLVGELRGSQVSDAAGMIHLRRAAVAGIALGDADAAVTSNGRAIAVRRFSLRGPLADVRARGVYENGIFALDGNVRTSFERLAPLARSVRGHGRIDVPVVIVGDGSRTVAQVAGARFSGAQLNGIALHGAAATVALRGNAVDVQAARLDAAGGHVVASGSFGNGGVLRLTLGGIDGAVLRSAGVPVEGGRFAGAATVSGTFRDPRGIAGVAFAGGRAAGAPVDAIVSASYGSGRARIDDARLAYGNAVVAANGTIAGITSRTPSVDVAAQAHDVDIATLAHRLRLPLRYPEGAVDANVHVRGAARDPALDGSARIAAGSLNGLAFRDVVVPVRGGMRGVQIRGGSATVGSTRLHFDGTASTGGARASLRSDRLDLADFNDYFDAADTLGGRGRVAVMLGYDRASVSTAGSVALSDARYRRLPIGAVDARWSSRGRTIAAAAHIGGAHGRLVAHGTAVVPARDPLAHLASSALDANAGVAAFDLTTWLPAAGIVAPVTGRVDGNAHVHGIAPNLAVSGRVSLHDGVAGRLPIHRLTIAATAERRRTRITEARLEAENLSATGSGSFGLGSNDPIALQLHAASPDIVAFANRAAGTTYDGAGALDTTLAVSGTRRAPAVRDVLDLDRPRYGRAAEKHVHLDVAFANRRLTLNQAVAELAAGRVTMSGAIPATMTPPFVDRRNGAIAARLLAEGVDLGQFAPLLPSGTKLGGVIDGDVRVAGTLSDPRLTGDAQLAHGSYVSPQLASRISDGTARVAFAGHRARLTTLHADVGGGAVDGSGVVTLGDLRDPAHTLAFRVDTLEKHVGLDVPKLIRGKMEGAIALSRDRGGPIVVAGHLDFSHTRIPLSALLPSGKPPSPNAAPPPVAFDLAVTASTDDRVQGPAVDIGARGAVQVGGTLAKPTLSGAMHATDGTVSVYRTFVLQKADVAFDPADGIIPMVDVTATSHVPDPSTDVLLHAYGPATGLTLDLASRPPYDRAQIVGLLVGAQNLGAVTGVARTSGPSGGGPNPVQGVAMGYVDQQFTRSLFQPFSSSLGHSLGFSTLNLNAGLTGGFSASASRSLGKNLESTFSQSEGADGQRQSVGLALNLNDATSFQLTLFNAGTQPRTIGVEAPLAPTGPTNYTLQALAPPAGSSGYVFTYVHRFP